jgi:hypothetical protein
MISLKGRSERKAKAESLQGNHVFGQCLEYYYMLQHYSSNSQVFQVGVYVISLKGRSERKAKAESFSGNRM